MGGCTSNQEQTTQEEKEISKFEDNAYFVNGDWVNVHLEDEDVIILDARGDKAYGKGHIKNALPVAWPNFAKMDVKPGVKGFGVLLNPEELGKKIADLGITKDKKVIAYGPAQDGWGEDGRIVWMLKMAGIEKAKMLNGSFEYWEDKGYAVSKEASEAKKSDFTLEKLDFSRNIDTKALMDKYNDYVILDTRTKDEYEGAIKYNEARGGHLPGAIFAPYSDLFNDDGTLKNQETLEKMFMDLGLSKEDKIVTYCTGGIRSAYMQLVLEMLGYKHAMNYDASFYEWAGNKDAKLGKVVDDKILKYYTAEQLQKSMKEKAPIHIVDIQPKEDFEKHHIKGVINTYAYPVKSDEDKAKLDKIIPVLEGDKEEIVIICPKGGGGATRTYEYLKDDKKIDEKRLFILEKGQAGWPFDVETNK
jgi:thiosulfate/3-mercaptopyruvate sulfurtransferase